MALNPAILPTKTVAALFCAALVFACIWQLGQRLSIAPWSGGRAESAPQLRVDGPVAVTSEGDVVTRITVALAVDGDDGVRLTEGNRLHAWTAMSESASAVVPATYAVKWLDGNDDEVLDPGEHAVLTAELPADSSVQPGNPIDLIIRPVEGMSLTVKVQ